jgi:hypothetical protein
MIRQVPFGYKKLYPYDLCIDDFEIRQHLNYQIFNDMFFVYLYGTDGA